ncbi:hypothetical protein KUTeg_016647 [Tegillarca granosa]|uniref:Uncharacterized protein n=1 Tax=Tegillarca granosa TaxID=220873 RepID=A0ABQ9ER91_TEGGR|nr:hypothetical protein KUTeg_016647 [Tegillarca granosa]
MAGAPDYYERKGSLFLRSNHMNYGRATLNSNWHQAREAEPKDYDFSRDSERDLCKATYQRIGNVTNGSLPQTTYQDHAAQTNLKEDFQEQVTRKPMVTLETMEHSHIDRKCNSQFTDTADYRRVGRNTWQDESGIYANTHFKREVFKPGNPIPESVS